MLLFAFKVFYQIKFVIFPAEFGLSSLLAEKWLINRRQGLFVFCVVAAHLTCFALLWFSLCHPMVISQTNERKMTIIMIR